MTPAINLLKKHKINFKIHKYKHDPKTQNYGLEASEKLNIDENRVFKTLLVQLNNKNLAVAIIPVNKSLCLKNIAIACESKSAKMANKDEAQKSTGYLLGGISPFAQKKLLKTVIDLSCKNFETIYVSGGERGLDIELNHKDFIKILNAQYFELGV